MQDASETELTSAATLITRYYIKPVIFLGIFFPQFIAAHTCLSTNSNLSVGCALVHNFDRKDALRCVCSWKICNLRPVCFVIVNSKIFVKATSTTVVTLLCTYLQHYSILWYAIPILDMVIQHPDAMQIILCYTVVYSSEFQKILTKLFLTEVGGEVGPGHAPQKIKQNVLQSLGTLCNEIISVTCTQVLGICRDERDICQ